MIRQGLMRGCLMAALLGAGTLVGCQQKQVGKASFVPSPALARSTLQLALNAWVEDNSSPKVEQGPQFNLVDAERDRRRLLEFTILGEVPQQDSRVFEAELRFADVDEVERRQYVIVGIDPLWVFRKEELEMLTHWDHPMPSTDESGESADAGEPKDNAGDSAGSNTQ